MSVDATVMDLAGFEAHVKNLLPGMKRQYDRAVNRDLSRQQSQGIFKRNMIVVLQQVYQDALELLGQVDFASEGQGNGADLIKWVLQAFDSLIDELVQYALHKHRSSCALSNFPDEHNPSLDYIAEVTRAIQEERSTFVAQVANLLPA